MTVEVDGRRYQAEVRRTAEPNADAGAAGPTWQITQDGTPVTSFPAEPSDTEASVREKIVAYLRAKPDMVE